MKAIIRRIGTQPSHSGTSSWKPSSGSKLWTPPRAHKRTTLTRDLVVGIAGIVGFCVGLLAGAGVLPWRVGCRPSVWQFCWEACRQAWPGS